MAAETILDLEDLARRYDTQVLREYLLEQEDARDLPPSRRVGEAAEEALEVELQGLLEVPDLRPRCFKRLRLLLLINFVAYWAGVAYCGYACHLRVLEVGLQAMPPLEAGLLAVFLLGTQATVEFAASACLTRHTRVSDTRSLGLRTWDGMAWLTGVGARLAVLLDVQCLALISRIAPSLCAISWHLLVCHRHLRVRGAISSSLWAFPQQRPLLIRQARSFFQGPRHPWHAGGYADLCAAICAK